MYEPGTLYPVAGALLGAVVVREVAGWFFQFLRRYS